jgi:KDO2-lipid IV(A) lauroyltransferase
MYYFVYAWLYLVSLLPLRFLYLLSDLLVFLIFRIIGYRRKVVLDNMRTAFPEKSEAEIMEMARKFYGLFIDSFMETIKLFSTGKSFIEKRLSVDLTLFHDLAEKSRSAQFHACHQFNWEMINHAFSMRMKQPLVAVFMPISNKIFERLFLKLRCRYGTVMVPATDMKNQFQLWRTRTHILALVADQNPGNPAKSFWLPFFNKPAPFTPTPEKYARLKACPVVFGYSRVVKRGYYTVHLETLCEDASLLNEGELTQRYVDRITSVIKEQPHNWLWSHRRWKHTWQEAYGPILPVYTRSDIQP